MLPQTAGHAWPKSKPGVELKRHRGPTWLWRPTAEWPRPRWATPRGDRKSTRLNSSHSQISYAVFCLKKKKKTRPSAVLNFLPGTLQPHTVWLYLATDRMIAAQHEWTAHTPYSSDERPVVDFCAVPMY